MEEPKFTKGPWHVCSGTKSVLGICSCMTISCSDHPIATVERGKWGDSYPAIRLTKDKGLSGMNAEAYMELIDYGEIPDDEAVANAHVLAAAPELFEALKATRTMFAAFIGPDDELGQACLNLAAAAIAKAEGREERK